MDNKLKDNWAEHNAKRRKPEVSLVIHFPDPLLIMSCIGGYFDINKVKIS